MLSFVHHHHHHHHHHHFFVWLFVCLFVSKHKWREKPVSVMQKKMKKKTVRLMSKLHKFTNDLCCFCFLVVLAYLFHSARRWREEARISNGKEEEKENRSI